MSMSMPGPLPLIRDAVPADRPATVEFNRLLAAETEHKVLDPAILDQGVARALAEPDRLRYWVAGLPLDNGRRLVGQTAITREWSDWRNGDHLPSVIRHLSCAICHLSFASVICHLPSVTSCPIPPPAAQPRFPATPSARHSTAGSDRDDWRRRPGAPRDR